MKKISIIIPTFNEESSLCRLLTSIQDTKYPQDHLDIIVVDDGSTDNTKKNAQRFTNVRIISHSKNLGRFASRKTGFEHAKYSDILFLDARLTVKNDIFLELNKITSNAAIGLCLSRKNENAYETFHNLILKKIFPRFYQNFGKEMMLSKKNFDELPKGTGVFYVSKAILKKAYLHLSTTEFSHDSSDDTKFLKTIVTFTDILLSPKVKVVTYSRTKLKAIIHHLFLRGAKFWDYYGDVRQKNFWKIIVLPFLIFTSLFTLILLYRNESIKIAIGIFLFWTALTVWIAGISKKMICVFLILPVVALSFYAGILRGMYIHSRFSKK